MADELEELCAVFTEEEEEEEEKEEEEEEEEEQLDVLAELLNKENETEVEAPGNHARTSLEKKPMKEPHDKPEQQQQQQQQEDVVALNGILSVV